MWCVFANAKEDTLALATQCIAAELVPALNQLDTMNGSITVVDAADVG